MRSIECINNRTGKSIVISETAFSPLFLAGLDGVYLTDNDVTVSDNTMADGGVYQGSRAEVRNIVITALDRPNNTYNQGVRDIVYSIFHKGDLGTFVYRENDLAPRKIEFYTESVRREDGGNRAFTISLLCPNPNFSDLYETQVYMANWVGQFEFIHEFVSNGEEIGVRLSDRLVNIVNESDADSIGFRAVIETSGTITNPSLSRVESVEHIAIGSQDNPFTLAAGSQLVITTGRSNKHVKVVTEGVETEVNSYLTEDSEFFNIMIGDNHIAYSAESGVGSMVVTIYYSIEYGGV